MKLIKATQFILPHIEKNKEYTDKKNTKKRRAEKNPKAPTNWKKTY